jgi:hypothetical protein
MLMISNEFLALIVPMEFCTNNLLAIKWFIYKHLQYLWSCPTNAPQTWESEKCGDNNLI